MYIEYFGTYVLDLWCFFPFKSISQGSALSLTNAYSSIVDFQAAYIVTSQPSILARIMDKKNQNLYYYLLFKNFAISSERSCKLISSQQFLHSTLYNLFKVKHYRVATKGLFTQG